MNTIDILCCPSCKELLHIPGVNDRTGEISDGYECYNCNKKFSSSEGYLDFLGNQELFHSSRREEIIRSTYAKIYTPATNFMFPFAEV